MQDRIPKSKQHGGLCSYTSAIQVLLIVVVTYPRTMVSAVKRVIVRIYYKFLSLKVIISIEKNGLVKSQATNKKAGHVSIRL